jgi:hypothetical protein
MAIKASNNIPFTVYSVKTESPKGVNIFLGVASQSNNATTTDYFPHQVISCKTTYLFASIVGTRNVKVTRPTTTDPYVYIETRRVAGNICEEYPATSFMSKSSERGIEMRTLSSDGSIQIKDNDCNYGLDTYKYDVKNVCSINGLFYRTIGTPGKSNVVWQFKDIEGDPPCVIITQNRGEIIFSNDTDLCCDS